MQITLETNGIWGTMKIAKYLGRSHNWPVVRELNAGRIPGAVCIAGRWFCSCADLDAYRRNYVDLRRKRAKA